MIIKRGTTHPITISHYPNNNWTGDDSYIVVDDNSELGKKISQHAPYYTEILNANGELIDITPTERPPVPQPEPTETDILKQEVAALWYEVMMK